MVQLLLSLRSRRNQHHRSDNPNQLMLQLLLPLRREGHQGMCHRHRGPYQLINQLLLVLRHRHR